MSHPDSLPGPGFMRLFILGATGRTGGHLLDLALAQGHQVTAFVRSPAKIQRHHHLLSVIQGDPRRAKEMGGVLAGHDAVLSALGPKPGEAMRHSTLLQECAASTVAAMQYAGVRRLAIVSAALLFPGGGPLVALARILLRPHLRDLEAMEEIIRASDVGWTIARPPRLVQAADTAYRAQSEALPSGLTLTARLSWRAVAAFLLDCVREERYLHRVVGIAH